MLDTNTVSFLIKDHPLVRKRMVRKPKASLCISAITEAELLFGLAKRPEATNLKAAVQEFLIRIEVLAWDSRAAERFGTEKAALEKGGKVISPFDLLIGCHALSSGLTLVTNDKSFKHLTDLKTEDWAG